MINARLALSRPAKVAADLAASGADVHRFHEKPVLLTGEAATLRTPNGQACIVDSLRLLVRITSDLTVVVPPGCGELADGLRAEAARIGFAAPVLIVVDDDAGVDHDRYDAILSVGHLARQDSHWTVIKAQGWLAQVSSSGRDLPEECDQSNPVAALAAASLGVSEVFKRLLGVSPEQAAPFDGVTLNLSSYRDDDTDPGPAIDRSITDDLLLIGAGAIGSGLIAVLSRLRLTGRVEVIDPQVYAEENLGTSLLLGPADVGQPKAFVAAATLRAAGIDATGYQETIAEYRKRVGFGRPAVVLNALDNITARHEAQDLWPDVVIDGAIGPLSAQVSRHPWGDNGEDIACLRCLFVDAAVDTTAAKVHMTGMSAERLNQGDEVVTEADIVAAPEDRRVWMREQKGKRICSIISPEELARLADGTGDQGFAASAPFVACLSAAMVIGEMVKHSLGLSSPVEPRYQVDLLQGPESGLTLEQGRRSGCACVVRRDNIETIRRRTTKQSSDPVVSNVSRPTS